jgi:hypothetical protein
MFFYISIFAKYYYGDSLGMTTLLPFFQTVNILWVVGTGRTVCVMATLTGGTKDIKMYKIHIVVK